jgi:hypothetical protein
LPRIIKPIKKKDLIAKSFKLLREETERQIEGRMGFCYFGTFNPAGEMDRNKWQTHCHSELSTFKGSEVLWTYTPPLPAVPESAEYFKWLLNESPWKLAGVIPKKTSLRFAMKHGFVIQNLDLPANLIGNFCIATRQPYEYLNMVKRWSQFCKDGVHPNVAYVFAEGLYGYNSWRTVSHGHEAIDPVLISVEAVSNFCHGKVGWPNQPFKKSGNYLPCCKVWEPKPKNENNLELLQRYSTFLSTTYPAVKLPEEAGRMFMVQEPIRVFGEYGWNNSKLSRSAEQWTEIAQAETKRIMG